MTRVTLEKEQQQHHWRAGSNRCKQIWKSNETIHLEKQGENPFERARRKFISQSQILDLLLIEGGRNINHHQRGGSVVGSII